MIIQGLWASTWTHLPCTHWEGVLTGPTLLNSLSTGSTRSLEIIEGILDLAWFAMTWKMEFGDGEVEVMGWDINLDHFWRIASKAGKKILAPLARNIIGKCNPVDQGIFCRESGKDDIVHVFVPEIMRWLISQYEEEYRRESTFRLSGGLQSQACD